MAIRIKHGDVGTLAQFGVQAGKGRQEARASEVQAGLDQQAAAANARVAAEKIRSDTNTHMQIMDAENRREAVEFQSFLQAESAKRSMAWEQEKIERREQHDFEMVEARRDMENQLEIAESMLEKNKLSSKMTALDRAAERGDISPKQARDEKLRLEIGAPGGLSPIFQKQSAEDKIFEMLGMDERAPLTKTARDPKTGKEIFFNAETNQWQDVK